MSGAEQASPAFLSAQSSPVGSGRTGLFLFGVPDSAHSEGPSTADAGPALLRRASALVGVRGLPDEGLWDAALGRSILAGVQMVDLGDVSFPTSLDECETLQQVLAESAGDGLLVGLLGDDACNFPLMVGRAGTLIHLDAHDDRAQGRAKLSHGNFLAHLVEHSDLEIIQYGLRGLVDPYRCPPSHPRVRLAHNLAELASLVGEAFEGPVYVSIDVDILDPLWLDSVQCPEPEGLTFDDVARALSVVALVGSRARLVTLSEFAPAGASVASLTQALRLLRLLLRFLDALTRKGKEAA